MNAVAIRVRGVRRCHAIVMRVAEGVDQSEVGKMRLRISIMIELFVCCCLNIVDDVFSEFVFKQDEARISIYRSFLLTFLHNCSSKPNL